ncbi:hypothetical protein [Lignipirellula cremea]|uniref:AsmA-like C-terminal domain-containing protein n=1 Tax=Lignipirellula cremea TaxID=2528010 RepID=A0A518E345_9BACT|nr:hypothetical protein [Lignipirellula cremea]QDU98473.1 hypothetical protein Pla8534_63420 [Lignipirellula cremea]
MSQEQRQFLCRGGFLLFCLGPTVYFSLWLLLLVPARLSPQGTADWEREISLQLGLSVELGRVSFPSSSRVLVEDLLLRDPETGLEVARAQSMEIATTDHGLVLLAESPEVRVEALAAAWESAERRILFRRTRLQDRVHLLARRITFVAPTRPGEPVQTETFVDFECRLEQLADRAEISLQLRRRDVELTELATFRASRQPGVAGETVTQIDFNNARSTPLPCWVLARHVPALANLGEKAEFQGQASLVLTPTSWQGEIDGRLTQIELERLVTQQFPHKLSGTAEIITYHPARFENGRLIEASGVLNSPGGVVGHELLRAAAEMFPIEVARQIPAQAPYDQLSVGFAISQAGLTLSGNCSAAGVLLRDVSGPLLVERARTASPVISLVRMLAPISELQVPATQETEPLLRALPIPSYATPRTDTRAFGPTSTSLK